jgi:hypothetical protein
VPAQPEHGAQAKCRRAKSAMREQVARGPYPDKHRGGRLIPGVSRMAFRENSRKAHGLSRGKPDASEPWLHVTVKQQAR